MCERATKWAYQQDASASEKSVLAFLAHLANRDGICWPRVETIAEGTGFCRRTVIRSMQSLESRGLLTRTGRTGQHGGKASNLYALQVGE